MNSGREGVSRTDLSTMRDRRGGLEGGRRNGRAEDGSTLGKLLRWLWRLRLAEKVVFVVAVFVGRPAEGRPETGTQQGRGGGEGRRQATQQGD